MVISPQKQHPPPLDHQPHQTPSNTYIVTYLPTHSLSLFPKTQTFSLLQITISSLQPQSSNFFITTSPQTHIPQLQHHIFIHPHIIIIIT